MKPGMNIGIRKIFPPWLQIAHRQVHFTAAAFTQYWLAQWQAEV